MWTEFLASPRVTLWGATLFLLLATVPGLLAEKGPPTLPYAIAIALAMASLVTLGNRILFTVGVAALMFAAGGATKLAISLDPGRMTRSFFGVYSVGDVPGPARVLVHGTTVHGVEMLGNADRERAATSYYAPKSGVGIAMRAAPRLFGPDAQIHVIGLGAGTLACYAQPGQHWKFFEIDPAVAVIARDPKRFRFLARCLPNVPVEVGDARLSLAREPAGKTDVLVVDAFSSDSVPMHLLTREAFESYRRQLTPDGLLMVHISNRFVSLEPVLAQAARRGWTARARFFDPGKEELAARQTASLWVAMSPARRTIDRLVASSPGDEWGPLPNPVGSKEWTDDYSSIIPLLKW
jgi:SAM-dependent methyltransferase